MQTYYHINRDLISNFIDCDMDDLFAFIAVLKNKSCRLLVVSHLCQVSLYDFEFHFRFDEVTIEYKGTDSSFFISLSYSKFVNLLTHKHISYMSHDIYLTY